MNRIHFIISFSYIPRIKVMFWVMMRWKYVISLSIMILMPVFIWKACLIFRLRLFLMKVFMIIHHMMMVKVMMSSMMAMVSTSTSHKMLTVISKMIRRLFLLKNISIFKICLTRLWSRWLGLKIRNLVIFIALSCLYFLQTFMHLTQLEGVCLVTFWLLMRMLFQGCFVFTLATFLTLNLLLYRLLVFLHL